MSLVYLIDANTGHLVEVDTDNPSGNIYVQDSNTGKLVLVNLSSPTGTINLIDADTGHFISVDMSNPSGTIHAVNPETGKIELINLSNLSGTSYIRDENTGHNIQIDLSTSKLLDLGDIEIPINNTGLQLPKVSSATLLLNLQADILSLNNNDPVSLWADASGLGHDFTASGTARPAFHTDAQVGYVQPDGVNDWMDGGDFADNLDAFALIFVTFYDVGPSSSPVITKLNVDAEFNQAGWYADPFSVKLYQDNSNLKYQSQDVVGLPQIIVYEYLGGTGLNMYQDGVLKNTETPCGLIGSASTFTSPAHVLLFVDGGVEGPGNDGYSDAPLRAMLIFHITDLVNWPADRASVIAWQATKYGITLP